MHGAKCSAKAEAPETKVEPRKSLDQRIREWGEKCRADATAITTTVITGRPLATRVASRRATPWATRGLAMDGTVWRRIKLGRATGADHGDLSQTDPTVMADLADKRESPDPGDSRGVGAPAIPSSAIRRW